MSNFHSSRSTDTKNCLMPSSVSSSRLTKTLIGSVINFLVISSTSTGNVAETKTTWERIGKKDKESRNKTSSPFHFLYPLPHPRQLGTATEWICTCVEGGRYR